MNCASAFCKIILIVSDLPDLSNHEIGKIYFRCSLLVLEFIGGVPFDILRPVLERTTYEQLITLEDYNPYLMEDTHCLWEQHCKLRFRSKSRQELETWRDMYMVRNLHVRSTTEITFLLPIDSVALTKNRQNLTV